MKREMSHPESSAYNEYLRVFRREIILRLKRKRGMTLRRRRRIFSKKVYFVKINNLLSGMNLQGRKVRFIMWLFINDL